MISYTPELLRLYPFALQQTVVEGQPKPYLCFIQDSGLYRETPDPDQGDLRFFKDDGQLQPWLRLILNSLVKMEASRAVTRRAIAVIEELDLLEAWNINEQPPLNTLIGGIMLLCSVFLFVFITAKEEYSANV